MYKQKLININIFCLLLLLISSVNSFHHQFKHRSLAFLDDDDQQSYMELRATVPSNDTNTGFEITLQNRAAMNTRLRVLYIDGDGNPGIAETGRLWLGQTKSVKLPPNAKSIYIIVEKDLFFENWHTAYKGALTNGNECIRIVGVTLFSKIHPCK